MTLSFMTQSQLFVIKSLNVPANSTIMAISARWALKVCPSYACTEEAEYHLKFFEKKIRWYSEILEILAPAGIELKSWNCLVFARILANSYISWAGDTSSSSVQLIFRYFKFFLLFDTLKIHFEKWNYVFCWRFCTKYEGTYMKKVRSFQ